MFPRPPREKPYPKHYAHDKIKTGFHMNADAEAHDTLAQNHGDALGTASSGQKDCGLPPPQHRCPATPTTREVSL